MSHKFLDYVEDMLDTMDKAELALTGIDFDRFSEDFIINFAVARALEIMGKAAKRLPPEVHTAYPAICLQPPFAPPSSLV